MGLDGHWEGWRRVQLIPSTACSWPIRLVLAFDTLRWGTAPRDTLWLWPGSWMPRIAGRPVAYDIVLFPTVLACMFTVLLNAVKVKNEWLRAHSSQARVPMCQPGSFLETMEHAVAMQS